MPSGDKTRWWSRQDRHSEREQPSPIASLGIGRRADVQEHATIASNITVKTYDLTLSTDFSAFKFDGKETISATIGNGTKTITLNAKELEIRGAVVRTQDGEQAAEIRVNPKDETVQLVLKQEVKGDVQISVDFSGVNNDKMYGFYRSRYTYNGREESMLSTHFEPADARAAFPCIDEPEQKARFTISVVTDRDKDVVSNMPVKEVKAAADPAKKVVVFDGTPKMATYLAYVGVGNFEYTEETYKGVKIRVVTTPGKSDMAKLPLEYAKKFLDVFQDYFGINYQLPKLDLIAVPDFAVGAMENWGAITFRETALLGTEKTSLVGRQRIAQVVAHEMAHQWFGDLVTMKWWNDLWLNESFATFMENKARDAVYPEWKIGQMVLQNTRRLAQAADQLRSTHPISVPVRTPADVDELFDRISYEKGGSVLTMLEDFVGPETFRKGLHAYLEKNSYSNATKTDLWGAIQEAARQEGKAIPVTAFMESWVNKPGYPVVEVKRTIGGFKLRQSRFVMAGDERDTWPIGLHYATKDGEGKALMEDRTMKVSTKSDWIKLNYGEKGFYRVKYPPKVLNKLGEMIRSKQLSDADAWGIENDLYAFTRSGRVTVREYLKFVNDYCMDVGYPLNVNIDGKDGHLAWLTQMTKGTHLEAEVRDTRVRFNKGILAKVGWAPRAGEPTTDTLVRTEAIASLGFAGDKEAVDRARQLFQGLVQGKAAIDPDISLAVYKVVAYNGDGSTFDALADLYRKETRPEEKVKLLIGLASFSDTTLMKRALDFSNSSEVRSQDSFYMPLYIALIPNGPEALWDWSKQHWGELLNKYSMNGKLLSDFVENLSQVHTPSVQADISAFFSNPANMRDDVRRDVANSEEYMEANMAFMRANGLSKPTRMLLRTTPG